MGFFSTPFTSSFNRLGELSHRFIQILVIDQCFRIAESQGYRNPALSSSFVLDQEFLYEAMDPI